MKQDKLDSIQFSNQTNDNATITLYVNYWPAFNGKHGPRYGITIERIICGGCDLASKNNVDDYQYQSQTQIEFIYNTLESIQVFDYFNFEDHKLKLEYIDSDPIEHGVVVHKIKFKDNNIKIIEDDQYNDIKTKLNMSLSQQQYNQLRDWILSKVQL